MTVHQDAAIDALVNGTQTAKPATVHKPKTNETKTTTKTDTPKTTKVTTQDDRAKRDNKTTEQAARNNQQAGNNNEKVGKKTEQVPQNDTSDSQKKVMRNSYKIDGFRVQAFAGGNTRKDRLKAEQIGENIKANIPGEPVYVHFYSPRWICRVGNYRTYEEAHQMLEAIRKLGYTQASIVKGKISVQY